MASALLDSHPIEALRTGGNRINQHTNSASTVHICHRRSTRITQIIFVFQGIEPSIHCKHRDVELISLE
jgi:hypothetical protein